jgi:hypothetical protein
LRATYTSGTTKNIKKLLWATLASLAKLTFTVLQFSSPPFFFRMTTDDVASIALRNDGIYVPADKRGFPEDMNLSGNYLSAE